jgi:hypothetical protein
LFTGDFERLTDRSPYLSGVSSRDSKLLKATLLAEFFISCSSKNCFKGDLFLDLCPEIAGTVKGSLDFLV